MSEAVVDRTAQEPKPGRRGIGSLISSTLGCIELWLAFSLLFVLLMRLTQPSDGASWLWPVDPLLTILFLVLMINVRRVQDRKWLTLSPLAAAILFASVSWINSMLYELTLSQVPGKYGGMHPTTVGSFVIAQGFYLPLAILGLWLVRRYRLTFRELFFVAGMTSLYEATTVGLASMISPLFFLSPIIIAYYFVVYSRFLSMGLLVVDERLLWSPNGYVISFTRKLLYGSLLGIACWICFVIWGEWMIYLLDDFRGFP